MLDSSPSVLILGIGNVLWADEGFGVRAVETLNRSHAFGPDVRVMDGGTQGLYLIHHVQDADILLVFDAIDYGLPPGTLRLIVGDDVPRFMGAKKMSLHQTGFQEVLAAAELLGGLPRHIALVGVQPQTLEDFGGSLRGAVKSQIDPAIAMGLAWLAGLGVEARARVGEPEPDEVLGACALDLVVYEAGRPDAAEAPRHGDPRVLADPALRFDPKPSGGDGTSLHVGLDGRRGG